MSKGLEYRLNAQWQSAIIEFKNAVKQSPENAKARFLLGQTYLEIYDFNSAVKELQRAEKLGYQKSEIAVPLAKAYLLTDDFDSLLENVEIDDGYSFGTQARVLALRARAHLEKNKQDLAYEALKKARSIDESNEDVRLAWGLFEQKRGNSGAQKDWIKPLLGEDKNIPDAWSQLASIEIENKNFDEAEKAYTKAIKLRQYPHPDIARRALTRIELEKFSEAQQDIDNLKSVGLAGPIVLYAEGLVSFFQEKREQAKTSFQHVISVSPDYLPPRYMLALIYFSEKDYVSANAHLKLFTSANPDHLAANVLHANILLQLNQLEELIPLVDRLLKQNSSIARLYEIKGIALSKQNKLPEAIEAFKDGLLADPNNADIAMRLGMVLSRQPGSEQQGEKYLMRARELSPRSSRVNLALYLNYVRQKRFDDARALAQQMTLDDDSPTSAANLVGLSYLAQGQTERAIQEFERILEQNENDPVTTQNLARIYMQNNRLDKAKQLLSSAVKENPGDMRSLGQLAAISARQGNNEEVLDWLKQSMDNNPNELSPRLMLALQHLRSNDATSAVQVLNGVEEGQKDNTQYLLLMAQAKLGVKEHTHAIRLLKTLLNRNPELPQAHFMLAMAYGADNDLNRMRESLEQTVKMAPTNFLANLYLARLYYSEKKTEPFLAQVEKITAINPEHPDVRLLNASKASIAGDYAGAIKILLALKKDNSHPEVYLQLADNQRKSGQLEQAIATLEKWPGSMEQDARVSFLLAQYYMEGMSYSQAREVYLRLEKMMPDNMVLLNNLAWLMRDIDISRGIEFGEKALKINPENPMVQDTVAMLYLSNGQNRKALDLASRAASTLPDYVEIQVNYARALIANDRSAKARDLLKRLKSKAASSSDRKLIDEVLSSL